MRGDTRIYGQGGRGFKSRRRDHYLIPRSALPCFPALGHSEPLSRAMTVATTCGWNNLETLVATAAQLGNTMSAEPLAHVVQGYHRFRRYAPRMLRALDIKSASVAEPLMAAANIIIENNDVAEKPITFLRRNSKWLRHLKVQETDCHRLWEVAVTQILLFPISSPSGGRAESFLVARSGPAGGSQKNRSFVGRSRRRRAARRRPFYLSGNGNPIGLRSINSVA